MRLAPRLIIVVGLALIAAQSSLAAETPRKIDEYGAVNCEDEMARLDNYSVAMKNEPLAQAVVIVYGGRRGTRRDEVVARMAYVRHYLTNHHGISRGRIKVLNGGFRESLTTELYVLPAGVDEKLFISPTVAAGEVRYRRGRAGSRIRRCNWIG